MAARAATGARLEGLMTKVGIGVSHGGDAFESGRAAARTAIQAGAITRPDLAIALCAGALDARAFYEGVRAALHPSPEAPVIGGSAIGIITHDELSYRGTPAAVAVVESDTMRFRVAAAGGIDGDESAVGDALARALAREADDRLLLALYDSVRTPAGPSGPPLLNSSAPLLAGLERALGEGFPIVGAGLVGGYDFGPTVQFCGGSAETKHAVGCVVSGAVTPYVAVMHGCIPLDGVYRTITSMRGDVLHALDGRPITTIIDELFGDAGWRAQHPLTALTIGVNCGERFGAPREDAYANRLITGLSPGGDGVGMFEPDLAPGVEIQFMLRDNQTMFESVRRNTEALLARVEADGRHPALALYVDCGGRTAMQSFTEEEEASLVQSILRARGVPLLGFYSGVEIAPLLGRNRGLDWTGVLLVLAEEPAG